MSISLNAELIIFNSVVISPDSYIALETSISLGSVLDTLNFNLLSSLFSSCYISNKYASFLLTS